MFEAYPPLGTAALGALLALTGAPPNAVLSAILVALWLLLPAAWYGGGRAAGLDRLGALCLAILALAPSDDTGFGLGLRMTFEHGLYAQLWGAVLLPLAIGALHGALWGERTPPARAGLALGVLVLAHPFFGVLACELAGLLVLLGGPGHRRRARALLLVGAVALFVSSPWLVPALRHMPDNGGSPWAGARENGAPFAEAVRRLLSGAIFDHGRAPWLTALVALGVGGALAGRGRGARLALLALCLGFALWLGRTGFGPAYDALPLHRDLDAMRYLAGIHAAGLFLAAPALAALLSAAERQLARRGAPAGLATAALLTALVVDRARALEAIDRPTLASEERSAAAVALAARHDGGRFFGSAQLRSQSVLLRDELARRSGRPLLASNGRGFHDTLGTYYALDFAPARAAAAELYHVTELVSVGVDPAPEGPWRLARELGPIALWSRTSSAGYFALLRSAGAIGGAPRALRPLLAARAPAAYAAGWTVGLEPERPADPADAALFTRSATSAPGLVLAEAARTTSYACRVKVLDDGAWALLKVGFDRGWEATLDGATRLPVERAAPSFMRVPLPRGEHLLELSYHGPPERGPLALVALAVALWALAQRPRSRSASASSSGRAADTSTR